MEGGRRKIRYYQDQRGRVWFQEWLNDLSDPAAIVRIQARVHRMAGGNLGDHKALPGGIFELRVHAGPGYRVYGAQDGPVIVVLLLGGDKSGQASDIARARAAWTDYLSRSHR